MHNKNTPSRFEQTILDDPKNIDHYLVYADWLSEQGNPLGEFISIQLALEEEGHSSKQRKQLKKREQELLDKNIDDWLGPLAAYYLNDDSIEKSDGYRNYSYEFNFSRGFLSDIVVDLMNVPFAWALHHSPACKWLKKLSINESEYLSKNITIEDKTYKETQIEPLIGAQFQHLNYFRIGLESDGLDSCYASGSEVHALLPTMPHIETLYLAASSIQCKTLFAHPMPKLKHLTVHHLYEYPLSILAENPSLTQLETLCMFPHMYHDGDPYLDLNDLDAIIHSPYLKKLIYLQFNGSVAGDDGLKHIIQSGFLSQLKVLDFGYSGVTDKGVELLLQAKETKQLEQLILSGNYLTQNAIKQLKDSGINIVAIEQHDLSAMENDEHLYHGDME